MQIKTLVNKSTFFFITAVALAAALGFGVSGQQTDGSRSIADSSSAIELQPNIEQARTAEEILIRLQRKHYHKRLFDDDLSSALLDNYLIHLDPSKSYFTQAEIDSYEQYRFDLDDGVKRGNLTPSFSIFNQYRENVISQLNILVTELPERIANLDFSIKEEIIVDNDSRSWPKNDTERTDRARKTFKNAVLSLRLSDKDNESIIEALKKRYKNQLNRILQLNTEDVFQIYMNSLTELYDPHTNYLSPQTAENFSISMRLSLEGIGAVLSRKGEHTVVERLITAGPADKQGELKPKDKIVGVGQGSESDAIDVVGWRLDEVVDLIRGKKNTQVKLEVVSERSANPDETKTILITRNTVKLEEQAANQSVLDIIYDEQLHKIGVIKIPTFYIDFNARRKGDPNYKSTTRDVKKLIDELETQDVEGIVIDLRGNGGGSLEEVNQLTRLFVRAGPVVQIKYSNGSIRPTVGQNNPKYYKKPMVVLIDRLSASASEIFAGAIQDYQRGLVIGSQSFGKGTVQQLVDLSHGSLKFTEAKFYRVSGESTQHRGVIPDIVLPSLYDHQEIGENTLDYALSWDTVKPARHKDYYDFDSIEKNLFEKHQSRMDGDPDYQYLLDQIALNEKYAGLKVLSLNEEERRVFIDSDKAERKRIETNFRAAKGLPPLEEEDPTKSVSNDEDLIQASDKTNSQDTSAELSEEDEKENDPRTDFLLTESAYILLDAIGILESKTTAQAAKPIAAIK